MISYNLNTAVKIKVFKKNASNYWSWHPEESCFFGLFKKPARFVNKYDSINAKINEECPFRHYLEKTKNGLMIIYEDPHVTVWFNNGSNRAFYFDTAEEAETAAGRFKALTKDEWYTH